MNMQRNPAGAKKFICSGSSPISLLTNFPSIHNSRENSNHAGDGQKSLKRATGIIQMSQNPNDQDWDHREIEKYGLGTGHSTN